MKLKLHLLLAAMLATMLAIPAYATDDFTWKPGKFKIKAGGVRTSTILGTIIPISTLAQNTVYTLPDPGATGTIAITGLGQTFSGTNTFSGVNTFTAVPIFPLGGITLKGTSFNGTLKQLATLGQATTFSLPDPAAATDTVATVGAGNAFTGVNSFSLANGLQLKGTSFNDTVIAKSTQAQASTLTVHDVGGATGEIYTMTAAQTAAGVLSRADMVTETGVTIWRNLLGVRNITGAVLGTSAGAGVFGVTTTATFGSPANLLLVSEAANSNTKTDWCEFEVLMPPDYVAGSAITVNVNQNIIIGGGTLSVKTLTVDAFKLAAAGTVGSNLGPAAQTLSTPAANLAFVITPTGIVAGDKLLIQLQTVLTETAASNVTVTLNDINVQTSVKM